MQKKNLHLYCKNEIVENKVHNDLHTFEPYNLYDFLFLIKHCNICIIL